MISAVNQLTTDELNTVTGGGKSGIGMVVIVGLLCISISRCSDRLLPVELYSRASVGSMKAGPDVHSHREDRTTPTDPGI